MFRSKMGSAVLGAVVAIAVGCAPDSGNGRLNNTNPNDPATGPGPDMATAEWDGGFSDKCGVQDFMLQAGLPPEVMIVLDRSGSMTSTFDSGTRWSKVTAAVEQVVAGLQGQIGWGLTVFPTDNNCGTSATVAVQVASMNSGAINAKIATYTPDGNTPTQDAVKKAAAYMAGRTTANPKYLLLATDGEPNCGTVGTTCSCVIGSVNAMGQCCSGPICYGACIQVPSDDGASAAIQSTTDAAAMGVHTFVVGVAADSTAGDALNKIAIAGKEPKTGPTKYYAVASAADLVTAVNTIAGQIISCSFALSSAPPTDPDLVEMNVNNVLVPHDTTHANGWDFGPGNMSIQFYGAACTNLQTQAGATVQAVYKCPPTL